VIYGIAASISVNRRRAVAATAFIHVAAVYYEQPGRHEPTSDVSSIERDDIIMRRRYSLSLSRATVPPAALWSHAVLR